MFWGALTARDRCGGRGKNTYYKDTSTRFCLIIQIGVLQRSKDSSLSTIVVDIGKVILSLYEYSLITFHCMYNILKVYSLSGHKVDVINVTILWFYFIIPTFRKQYFLLRTRNMLFIKTIFFLESFHFGGGAARQGET